MFWYCCFVLHVTLAFLLNFGYGEWDGLKVKFGVYDKLPRSETAAINEGYTKLSDCWDFTPFAGKRYAKDGDTAIVLLYDAEGNIAGIQAGFSKTQPNGYPKSPLKDHPFVLYGDKQYVTVYFVDPATICSKGRACGMFKKKGTGTDLYIQNGTTHSHMHVVKIPNNEADLTTTQWTKGKCFPSMGLHYFYNVRKNMSCEEFYPVFLLYTGGKLNAFGWIFITDLPSTRYEHPPPGVSGGFIDPEPDCVKDLGRTSTMHIYLTDDPKLNVCP